ncbi:D-alanyl-D-alanine carboxypeptidase [Streptococcus sinensis]|uniref:D-alanyl-D-alanine carboxypeptidase n=1 Tax=Streptococcus sinensis TaxID=176090 RepID=A0A0A0DHB6_9STRE|nr:D-alanyl-D-alanine carboxypeptidase [Streptococcus sinensis]
MKKKFFVLGLILSAVLSPLAASADELVDRAQKMYPNDHVQAINRPKSSLMIDGNTGDVLWQDNIDEVRDPASMSKVMTLYLVFEAIKEGKLSLDTVIKATPQDQAIAGIYEISNNKIVAGVDYTVSELITMTVVPSSNATTVMLANYLSNNDPDAFLDKMNAKAQELGMTNTKWFNASGAAAISFKGYYTPQNYDNYASNQTTARDLGILVYNFVKNYPDILNYTNQAKVTVKAGTPYEETFDTYNYSLPGARYALEGVDGLKTGSSPNGAFNYIATVKRGDQRVIGVIMGVGDWSDQDGEYYRHPFGNALIEKAYADYEYKKVFSKGEQEIDGETYNLPEDFYVTVKKGTEPKVKVENGVLKAENDLTTLSTLISDGMKVERVERSIAQSVKEVATGKNTKKAWYNLLINNRLLILLPVGILVLILFAENSKRKKRRAQAKTRRDRYR